MIEGYAAFYKRILHAKRSHLNELKVIDRRLNMFDQLGDIQYWKKLQRPRNISKTLKQKLWNDI